MGIFKRRLFILLYIVHAIFDGLCRVSDYGKLAEKVMAHSRLNYSQFHLTLRFRACSIVMKIAERLGSKWACRHYSIMLLRACLREGAPSNLCFEIRMEDGRYVGHMTISDSQDDDSNMTVKLPFNDTDENPWNRG